MIYVYIETPVMSLFLSLGIALLLPSTSPQAVIQGNGSLLLVKGNSVSPAWGPGHRRDLWV